MINRTLIFVASMLLGIPTVCVALDPASPTTNWTVIQYGTGSSTDPTADQQTGSKESDIIGNLANPSFYKQFEGGGVLPAASWNLAFRVRVAEDKNPTGFTGAFFVGLDGNRDGKMDIFLGVNNAGAMNEIGIWAAGGGLNTSPSTTSIANTALFTYTETVLNYSWTPVNATIDPTATTFDLDAGGATDQFLSFVVPFSDVTSSLASVGITGVSENTPMSFIAATSTQANALNQDINNVNGGVSSSSTWAQLGASSQPYSAASTVVVPEPCSALLVAVGMALILSRRQRKVIGVASERSCCDL